MQCRGGVSTSGAWTEQRGKTILDRRVCTGVRIGEWVKGRWNIGNMNEWTKYSALVKNHDPETL